MRRFSAPPKYGRQVVSHVPSATSVAGVYGLGKPANKVRNNGLNIGVRVRRGRR